MYFDVYINDLICGYYRSFDDMIVFNIYFNVIGYLIDSVCIC